MQNSLSQPVQSLATEIFSGLASPRALSAYLLMKYGEWDQLASLSIDPKHYLSSEPFWVDSQATNLLRKYEPLPTSFDRKAVAEESFLSCEKECLRTNTRLYHLLDDSYESPVKDGVMPFVRECRKKIADILGPCPDHVSGRFGPGATYGDRGVLTTIPDKMSSRPTFTHDAWPFLFPWSGTLWATACTSTRKVPESVPGNRFVTVPKDCTKFRGIAIEPSINLFYQLAYGQVIRDRLRMRGIDLAVGQDVHRALARDASKRGHLATMDLSNASDTVCRNLVKLLLPHKWFEVLDSLRSKKTLFKGKNYLLEKFSSMGNGFTFELETLLFLVITAVASRHGVIGVDVFTYGDDIICPSDCSKDVISALTFFGFSVNERKTFVDGKFRESCGGDFFDGAPVRSFFLKADIDQPFKVISMVNGLKESCKDNPFRFHSLYRGWRYGLSRLPTEIRSLRGPKDLGDIVIHDDIERWRYRWWHGIRYIKCYMPNRHTSVRWNGFAPDVILASAVYGLRWNEGVIHPRNSVLDYKIGQVAFS